MKRNLGANAAETHSAKPPSRLMSDCRHLGIDHHRRPLQQERKLARETGAVKVDDPVARNAEYLRVERLLSQTCHGNPQPFR